MGDKLRETPMLGVSVRYWATVNSFSAPWRGSYKSLNSAGGMNTTPPRDIFDVFDVLMMMMLESAV